MLNPLDIQDRHPFHDDDLLGDTPMGPLLLARQPWGDLEIELLDFLDPTYRRPLREDDRVSDLHHTVHVLDERGVLAVLYGNRPLECEAHYAMYQQKKALVKATMATRQALLRADDAREMRRLIVRDQDVAAFLLDKPVDIR